MSKTNFRSAELSDMNFVGTGRARTMVPDALYVTAKQVGQPLIRIDLLTGHPADPTNPRNDLIIVQASDTFYGDGSSGAAVNRREFAVASSSRSSRAPPGPSRKKSRQRPSFTSESCRTRPVIESPGVIVSVV